MLLNSTEVAAKLRLRPSTIRRYARQGTLPGTIRIGGCYRWPSETIDQWLSSGVPLDISSRPEVCDGGGACGRAIR